jgi:hypothetical protein
VELVDFVGTAANAFKTGVEPPRELMASLEFYTSARLEASERAKFIHLVTALEALSTPRDYGNEVAKVLNDLAKQFESSPALSGKENESIRKSVAGKLRQLRWEAIQHAIRRTVREYLGEDDDWKEVHLFLKEAYNVRSSILHEGQRGQRLNEASTRLEGILRRIYSSMLNLPLDRQVPL